MPNSNAVVSRTIRIEPPLDRAPAEMLRAERGLSVELDGGRRVRLDPGNPRSAGFAQVLDGLSKQRRPVYLEIDPATEAITRLLIPHVAHVASISSSQGQLDVKLDTSHARHVLQLGKPDSAELEKQLREALQSSRPVLVTEDDAHNIIDIRDFTPDPQGFQPAFPPREPKPPPRDRPLSWIRWLWWWICWPWWWFHCLSKTRAQQVFDAMGATSCDPLTVPAPCIPFLYPDDGCWARAHEMCRLMINMGLSPRKVWIDHSFGHWLHVNTKNNPQCYVEGMARRAHAVRPVEVLPDPAYGDGSVAIHDAGVGGNLERCARRSGRDSDPHQRRSVLARRRGRPDVYGFKRDPRSVPSGAAEPGEPGRTSALRELPVALMRLCTQSCSWWDSSHLLRVVVFSDRTQFCGSSSTFVGFLGNARKAKGRAEAAFWSSAVWLPAEAAGVAEHPAGNGPTDTALSIAMETAFSMGTAGSRGERMRRNAHKAGFRPTRYLRRQRSTRAIRTE